MREDHSQSIHAPGGAADPPGALRGALIQAIDRRRRRRRFRFAVAGVACTAIAAALLGGGLFNSGPSRVLAVDTNDGAWIKVSILDGQAGADQMTNELQDAGINGEVQLLPATPQFVGHWMGVREINAPSAQCQSSPPPGLSCANAPLLDAGEADVNGDVLEIRSDVVDKLDGAQLVFYVGRAPQGDEQPLDAPPAGQ